MDILDIISPETLNQLSQLGAVAVVVLLLIVLILVSNRLLSPFHTMTKMLRESQESITVSQRLMIETLGNVAGVVRENTQSNMQLRELIEHLSITNRSMGDRFEAFRFSLGETLRMVNAGIIIINASGSILAMNDTALEMLGWTEPNSDLSKVPVLDPLNKKFNMLELAARHPNPTLSIPIQVYDSADEIFRWVMFSAYPCAFCDEDGWTTIAINIIGRMETA